MCNKQLLKIRWASLGSSFFLTFDRSFIHGFQHVFTKKKIATKLPIMGILDSLHLVYFHISSYNPSF